MRSSPSIFGLCAGLAALLAAGVAFGRGGDHHDPTPASDNPPTIATSLPESVAQPAAARDALAERGFEFGLKYIGESFSDVSGGLRRGTIYDGKLRVSFDADLEKAFGLSGLVFHANASQLHGRGIDQFYTGALMPVSNIEATPTTRLFEAWLEQSFAEGASIRLGQMGADQEFMTRASAKIFVNNSFGWPALAIADLPAGGAAFPLSDLGARVKAETERFAFLAAIFDGDPAGPQKTFESPDPQRRNADGLRFRLKDAPFLIGEGQWKYSVDGLDGVAKIGGWRHFGGFADQRFGADGLSLADPASSGVPLRRRGNFGLYALVDQQIFRSGEQSAGAFARAEAAPNDRNLVNFYADAGVSFRGAPARPDDLFGVAVGYARVSSGARGLDRDGAAFGNGFAPIRSGEALVEATYIASVVPGWTLQPDLQYIRRPGGNIADPRDPSGVRSLRNALVVGLRTLIRY
ncbi:carbohydrate porin [Methylosinus sp. H3A]|uniref:carbohydrate porin n=1 Tax=Methylosinus sp. H3A TaxID=2785786 RepID=UPI0018C2F1CE|nr:carbohydrate porin [Methylosinus sp. H3A]MBG0811712.1 carbohydrate porin [Methylosinus sp. H3A]